MFFETNIRGEVIINTSRVLGRVSIDPWSLSSAEIEGRKQVREIERFLKQRIVGFEHAETVYSGPSIGVRSSRQIKGIYTLTLNDLLEQTKFPDVIAHSAYPIYIHSPDGAGTQHGDYKLKEIYNIPYRCLVSPEIENLITVGRSISATFEAQSAIRTTPTCGAIGHAGGVAAALAVQYNVDVKDIDTKELQGLLIMQKAYIEN